MTVLCNGLSDCGPDSGASDNERVILYLAGTTPPPAGTWQAFPVGRCLRHHRHQAGHRLPCSTCKTTYGGSSHSKDSAVSLEGGFSGALPGPVGVTLGTNDTLFKLVAPFDGELDCTETASLGSGDATTEITRANDTDGGCKGPVNGLLFNFDSGVDGSRLFVDMVTDPVEGAGSRPVPRSDHLELRRCS